MQCKNDLNIILDITWEQLNTGHWKDVNLNWRYVYTLASLFKVLCLLSLKDVDRLDIIKICDMGLLMGAPMMKNILSKIASKVSSMIVLEGNHDLLSQAKKVKFSPASENVQLKYIIKEERNLPQEEFLNNYLKKSCPVILTDSIGHWPALSSKCWSVDYILEKARYRTVPIEIGSKYTDDDWTQTLMTVGDFVGKYIKHKSDQKEIGYLAQHNLFNQIPELFEDVEVPSYITNKDDVDINVWFGPGGTVSPLHFDPKYNLLAQVIGEKYIRLYSEDQTENLYPRHDTLLSNTSHVDPENPDLDSFPLFAEAAYQECVLKPGQMLFIPPKCWHYVRSLSTSFSISFWW
ncbi:lysine-specific demethylase 8-like isoform X3 [Argiope bruennichi]|uniref:JmjC domain-containing protein 5 n=3 Tax=Argiope bruennichi TaxID=94029 RepID=A0A8T0F2S8_ARGBR|nr:lysine-specific demethylase 8-like isoform X3 [Argiope bruennichi]KAF8783259.1 Lysine-specific demethylase 8 like protein [Argiope bruennichi]